MNKILGTVLVLSVFFSCKKDENVCESTRFSEDIFTETSRTNITYGTATASDGSQVSLSMDIYQPVGDDFEKRPLIIWAHGGSFVAGGRLDMQSIARASALKGYVSASIDYRLLPLTGGIPDSLKLIDIAIKASHDMRAAVRFFRKSAADNNVYKIDTDNIFIGGVSAGAITALHAGTLDASDELPEYVKQIINSNGGMEGNSGTQDAKSFSSNVKGIINLSGAVVNPNIIDSSDPSIYSLHGDQDDVVPFDIGFAYVGPIPIVRLFGSNRINEQAKKVGIPTSLTVIQGGGHSNIYLEERFKAQLDAFNSKTFISLKEKICN
jgi:hypothetical protein